MTELQMGHDLDGALSVYNEGENNDHLNYPNYLNKYMLSGLVCNCEDTREIKDSFIMLDVLAFKVYDMIKTIIDSYKLSGGHEKIIEMRALSALDSGIYNKDIFGPLFKDFARKLYNLSDKFEGSIDKGIIELSRITDEGEMHRCSSCLNEIPLVKYPWIYLEQEDESERELDYPEVPFYKSLILL